MVRIMIRRHQSVQWVTSQNTYVRGWFYESGVFRQGENTLIFDDVLSEAEFLQKIKALNGNFCVIHRASDKTFVAVDRIMSFPVVYAREGNSVLISDSTETLRTHLAINAADPTRAQEFISAGFVTGNRTLFERIFVLEAGQYLVVNERTGEIAVKDYFVHTHGEYYDLTAEELCALHDRVVLDVFRRLVDSANGRHLTLFLSGGYDSRLVAVSLKRLKYDNVTCVSFGRPGSREAVVAESVARSLGFPWILVDCPRESIEDIQHEEKFKDYLLQSSNGYVLPYFQGLMCHRLIQDGTIPQSTIVLSGNSGDVIEGNQFCHKFEEGKLYGRNDIIDSLIDKHYRVFGKRESQSSTLRGFVSERIPDGNQYSYEECQDIYECFNWRERQAKYVVNDVRCYDSFLGVEWRLPLWDNGLVDFWLKVPTEMRAYRRLYYQYVRAEPYSTANRETSTQKVARRLKRNAMPVVELLYPLRKLGEYVRDRGSFYGVSARDYMKILFMTKGYRTSPITSRVYYVLTNCYGGLLEPFGKMYWGKRPNPSAGTDS